MTKFFIEQFGCRATQADGAAIERQLREHGCETAQEAGAADVVVLNTCTVTAAADAQARDAIRKIHAANAGARIIVTGCYAQRAPEEIAALPGVSYVVGNSHKPQIPGLIERIGRAGVSGADEAAMVPLGSLVGEIAAPEEISARILTGDVFAVEEVLVAPVLGGEGNHTRPTLKIQDGCNSRCSFCVIPFVRGKSRSLEAERVLEEIGRLVEGGFKEVVLSGINLGAYGRDLTPRVEFLELLRRILRETRVEQLRVSSIEPLDVTEELIELFASEPRIAQHFHIPLQSGSDRILAAMHRWYRTEHYARHVELIRERLPNAAIGADVITGFPGESETEHETTVRFVEGLPFTYLHVFSYSQRPGTKAALLPGHVAGHVIKRRARELRAMAEKKSREFRAAQAGRRMRVLTLHASTSEAKQGTSGKTPALSSNYLRVMVEGNFPANEWKDVALACDETEDELIGTIVKE